MITLSNGDKWIVDDKEIEGIDYDEACKGNVPETTPREFVDRLLEEEEHTLPRKLTDRYGWNCNFDPYDEVLGDIAVRTQHTDFARIFVMPWDEVIVIYFRPDCGGYDAEVASARFENIEAYNGTVTIA